LWHSLRARVSRGGEFLCGEFGIVDAMFAPVCVRFRGYGVPVDDVAARYMQTIFGLPAMREWDAAALDEIGRYAATDAYAGNQV